MTEKENIPRFRFTLDRRYIVFCFFAIISLFVWFMNKLSAEYSANLEYNLRIINSLTGGSYTDEKDNNITVNIQTEAPGFYIMGRQLRGMQTLNIDLKDKKAVPAPNSNNLIKLPTLYIKDKISDALSRNVAVVIIDPDTLQLKYSVPNSKKVPVLSNFTLSFQSEYLQTAPTLIEPDSIIITGQQNVLDTINAVHILPATYLNLNETVEANLLLSDIENVVLSQRRVKVSIPVERCTESVLKLPVTILNAPRSSSLLLLPPKVEVKYVVSLKDYPSINENDFKITVDYLQTDSLFSKRKLKVMVEQQPDNILSLEVSPEFVDFIQYKE